MVDLEHRFREADDLEVRDLWPEIVVRQPGSVPEQPTRHRVLAAVLAVVVAGAGVGIALWAFTDHGQRVIDRPKPTALVTAGDLARAIRQETGLCQTVEVLFGIAPWGATGWLQCTGKGSPLVLLSYPLSRRPSPAVVARERMAIVGPSWVVFPPDLETALRVHAVIGGRLVAKASSPTRESSLGQQTVIVDGAAFTVSGTDSPNGPCIGVSAPGGSIGGGCGRSQGSFRVGEGSIRVNGRLYDVVYGETPSGATRVEVVMSPTTTLSANASPGVWLVGIAAADEAGTADHVTVRAEDDAGNLIAEVRVPSLAAVRGAAKNAAHKQ